MIFAPYNLTQLIYSTEQFHQIYGKNNKETQKQKSHCCFQQLGYKFPIVSKRHVLTSEESVVAQNAKMSSVWD